MAAFTNPALQAPLCKKLSLGNVNGLKVSLRRMVSNGGVVQNPPKDYHHGDAHGLENHKYSQAAGPYWLAEAIKVPARRFVSHLSCCLWSQLASVLCCVPASPSFRCHEMQHDRNQGMPWYTQRHIRAKLSCRHHHFTLLIWRPRLRCWHMTTATCRGWWQPASVVSTCSLVARVQCAA